MAKYLVLIKNNIVQAVVVGDDDFANHVKDQYDLVVSINDECERPSTGDSYYVDTGLFISNTQHAHDIPVNLDIEHLQKGTEDGFEPFQISKYSVNYENGMVNIGCKKYSAPGLLDALHRSLIEKEKGTVSCFHLSSKGPSHGKFDITWDDAQLLYDNLIKVKF